MVDGALFQDEVKRKKIMSVPTVFLNDIEFGQGRMELEEIINKIDTKAGEKKLINYPKKSFSISLLLVGVQQVHRLQFIQQGKE